MSISQLQETVNAALRDDSHLQKIADLATQGRAAELCLQDFINADIRGVSANNLDMFIAHVASLPREQINSQKKLKDILSVVIRNQAAQKSKASENDDPLLDGVACLLRSLGNPLDIEQLRYGVPLTNGKILAEQLPHVLRRHDINAQLKEAPLNKIDSTLMPCLLLLKNGSSLVLKEYEHNTYLVTSPVTGGDIRLSEEKLTNLYAGFTLFAHTKSELLQAEDYGKEHHGHWFRSRLLKQWPAFSQVILASMLSSILAIAAALFAMQVYDRVVPTSAFGTLWALAIGVLLAVCFEFLLKGTRGQIIETLGKRLDLELSQTIFQHAVHIRLSHRPASVGAFANQVRDFESVREFFTAGSLGAFGDVPFVLLFLSMISIIGGPIVLVPIIAIVLMLLPVLILQPWLSRLSRAGVRESAVKNGVLLEAIDHLETIKVTQSEGRAEGQWQRLNEDNCSRGVRFRHANAWLSNWAMTSQQMASICIIIFGVYQIDAGNLTIGALIACSILTSRAISPTAQINGLLSRWQHVKVAIEGLDKLMATPIERPLDKKFTRLPHAKGSYTLKNVHWRYSEDQPKVLELDQFTIKAGEHIALLGGNGAGKSTFLRLLAGLYTASEGELLLDNLALAQIDPADRRRAIGYLPQDIALFHGNLRDNVNLQNRQIDDQSLLSILDMTGLGAFVRRHPMGLDLPIQANHSLSGGQRQAIGLARLVLQDPQIILMDEPTSALDQQTENQVIANMAPWLKGKTLILATHKLALLKWTERAIVLNDGMRVMDDTVSVVLGGKKPTATTQKTVINIKETAK